MKRATPFKGLLIAGCLMGLATSMAISPQNYDYDPGACSPAQFDGGGPGLNCNAAATNPHDPRYSPSLLGGAWHDY
jgi:hypothetical protein